MIDPEFRFFISGSAFLDGKPEIATNSFDWDQRRMLTIKGKVEQFPPFEDKEPLIIARHIDNLSPSVHAFTVDDEGLLVGVSTDEKDDRTFFISYPRFSDVESLADCRTVTCSQLKEVDRLGPGVDHCRYMDETGAQRNVVFKYSCIVQPMRR